MTLVIPEGFALVLHSMAWTGDPEPMSITYGIGDGATAADAQLIADQANAAFETFFPNVSDQLTLIQTEVVYQGTAPPDDPTIGITVSGVAGEAPGNVVPQNTAFLAHKRSATGGRGGRGRFYLPGVQESATDDLGNVDAGTIAALNTGFSTFLADLTASANIAGMVILHDSLGAHAADPPRVVTALTLDTRVATQRQRLRR